MRFEFQLAIATASFLTAMFAGVLSIHLTIKPSDVSWEFYDSEILFALNGDLNKLSQNSCNKNHTILFGSSILRRAFRLRDKNVKSYGRWSLDSSIIRDGLSLSLLKRPGGDLSFFLPIIDKLPQCPKTLILHSDVFLGPNQKEESTSAFSDLFSTAHFMFRKKLESFWPAQLDSSLLPHKAPRPPSKKSFTVSVEDKRLRYVAFKNMQPQHIKIIHDLIDNGAQIIILDIGRSTSLEAQISAELKRFRQSIQDFAQQTPRVQYLSFHSLDDSYYKDFKHLNRKGTKAFYNWFEPIYKAYRRDNI